MSIPLRDANGRFMSPPSLDPNAPTEIEIDFSDITQVRDWYKEAVKKISFTGFPDRFRSILENLRLKGGGNSIFGYAACLGNEPFVTFYPPRDRMMLESQRYQHSSIAINNNSISRLAWFNGFDPSSSLDIDGACFEEVPPHEYESA